VAAVLVAVLAAVVAGCGDDGTEPGATTVGGEAGGGTVEWSDCGGDFECGSVPVPRDYDDRASGRIDVGLIRYPASDPDARIGSLLVNPGGPGASGVEFVRSAASVFPDELQARFDIVGFDTRGTGATLPVDCRFDLDEVFALDTTPDDADERAALERTYAALADACADRNGDVLTLVSSQDTVRDMDRIRAAVGDDGLTYLGYSYGTYLGALYADRYPRRLRALILDGAVDPTLDPADSTIEQAVGFEDALDAFLAACADDSTCEFASEGDPAAALDALLADIDAEGVPAGGDRVLGPGEADIGLASALYLGDAGYAELADALAAAADGDGAPLLALTDSYTGRNDDGSYDGRQDAFWAIACADSGDPAGSEAERRALERRAAAAAPHFGVSSLNLGSVCRHWPVPPADGPDTIDAAGAPPILVIGTTGDPATPLAWAESLADQLGSAELVVVDGSQHGAFILGGSPCVDEIGIRYLVDLAVPREGTMCE
jgi:pimeloyl-ACP methyl ester carboxylesterase